MSPEKQRIAIAKEREWKPNPAENMSDDKEDAIVAIKPCCGHLIFAAVNKQNVVDDEMRKEIGELVVLGCKIEHWQVKDVRKAQWGCKCADI